MPIIDVTVRNRTAVDFKQVGTMVGDTVLAVAKQSSTVATHKSTWYMSSNTTIKII